MKTPIFESIDWLGSIAFNEGLTRQEETVERILAGDSGSAFFLLEHEPVYTIGRTRDRRSLNEDSLPYPAIEINRGGQATFHGPGQLVGYAVADLRKSERDLHAHLRWLEELVIDLCQIHGVKATRREGLTGVWCEDRKIASIGVGVRKWITMHGFALNVTAESLAGFSSIIPCGIDGVVMTSLEAEAGMPLEVEKVAGKCGTLLAR
ncbi:MAG: lipoyl(octanoyl) transferase LipB [Verrucomicrobiota bacterium]